MSTEIYLFEVWQHVSPAPSWVPQALPVFEINLSPSIPKHAVDKTTSAHSFSHGHMSNLAIKLDLWHGSKAPFVRAGRLQANVDRISDKVFVLIPYVGKCCEVWCGTLDHLQRPCLKTQDCGIRVLSQTGCKHES